MIKHLLIISILLNFTLAFAQQITDYSVVVEGNAVVEQIPEMVIFSASFSKTDTNYQACVNNTLLTVAAVKADLQKLNIDANLLKTNNFNINPEYEWDNDTRRQVFKGYKAIQNIELKIKFNAETVDKIFYTFNNKLKTEYRVGFELSDNQVKEMRKELLNLGITDATEKAKQIALACNIKLGKVSGVKYTSNSQPNAHYPETDFSTLSSANTLKSASIPQVAGSLTPQLIKLATTVLVIWDIDDTIETTQTPN